MFKKNTKNRHLYAYTQLAGWIQQNVFPLSPKLRVTQAMWWWFHAGHQICSHTRNTESPSASRMLPVGILQKETARREKEPLSRTVCRLIRYLLSVLASFLCQQIQSKCTQRNAPSRYQHAKHSHINAST